MKKLAYISMILTAVISTSCEDLLDAPTKSSMDETTIFTTEALADAAVMAFTNLLGKRTHTADVISHILV